MKRNPRLPPTAPKRVRRSAASEAPLVPTYRSDSEQKADRPAEPRLENDTAEEAVRRMVEAAYT